MRDADLSATLLAWYDRNARNLPWRIPPARSRNGELPDPYRVWLSEVMLQQTTVPVAARYFDRFCDRWPTVEDLAAAEDRDILAAWAGLGYYARARNLIKCARIVVNDLGGEFPRTETELVKLPGIGPYTAAAITAIAHDFRAIAVDGNIERIVARLHAVRQPLPKAKPDLRKLAAQLLPSRRYGDFSQAMMDLGSIVCRPRRPDCENCPWSQACRARELGIEDSLPARMRKAAKPQVLGEAYVGRREDGAWLLERRPGKGLLGGMPGWPGSGWGHEVAAEPPWDGDWHRVEGSVSHVFTHFKLELRVFVAKIPAAGAADRGEFVPAEEFVRDSLPTLMRKVFDLALPSFCP